MQSTYLEVELDEGSEGRPELLLYVALAHEMQRRPLRRREGLEEAELLQSEVHSEAIRGAIRCNQKDWRRPSSCNRLDRWFRYRQAQSDTLRVMTCLQPGDETDGLDSDTVIDVLDHR